MTAQFSFARWLSRRPAKRSRRPLANGGVERDGSVARRAQGKAGRERYHPFAGPATSDYLDSQRDRCSRNGEADDSKDTRHTCAHAHNPHELDVAEPNRVTGDEPRESERSHP